MNEHLEVLALLVDAHRPYGWTDRSYDGYMVAVADLPVEHVRRAVVESLRTDDKMPSPSRLRRTVLANVTEHTPDVDDAWSEVRRAFGSHGRTQTPAWSHELIADTIAALGGWSRCCTDQDQTGVRIAFHRSYQRLQERTEREALIAPEFRNALNSATVFHQLEDGTP